MAEQQQQEEQQQRERRREALSMQNLERYYAFVALSSSAYFTHHAARLLLAERVGCLRVTIDALCDVCLMQRGAAVEPLLHTLNSISAETTVVSGAGGHPVFDPFTAFLAMARAFGASWEGTGASRFLRLELRCDALAEAAAAAGGVNTDAEDPPPIPGSTLELLSQVTLAAVGSAACDWLLPPQAVNRYGDLFVCLIFWRWSADTLKRIWQLSMTCRMAEVWSFCALARSVLTTIMEVVWYGLSRAVNAYRRGLYESARHPTFAHLGALTLEHEEFLGDCFHECLLLPHFLQARKLLRGLVRIAEEVEVGVSVHLRRLGDQSPTVGAPALQALRMQVKQRQGLFCTMAEKFVEQIRAADEGTAATSNLAAVVRAVSPLLRATHRQ